MKNDRLNETGQEILDPNPIEVAAGFRRPETLQESIERIMRVSEVVAQARSGYETFEEADDFDVPDDDTFDPDTPFEQVYDPVLQKEVTAAELLANPELYQRLYSEAVAEAAQPEGSFDGEAVAGGGGTPDSGSTPQDATKVEGA